MPDFSAYDDGKVVEVVVQEGKNFKTNGECVGSYYKGRRSYLVFLPRSQTYKPGETIRIVLSVIPNAKDPEQPGTDSRGSVLYRSTLAEPQRVDRWRENPDGTISHVTIETDWCLQSRDAKVIEGPRPKAQRESSPSISTDEEVVWGNDLASSFVRSTPKDVYQVEEERIEKNALVWRRIGIREDPLPPQDYPILSWKIWSFGSMNPLSVKYSTTGDIRIEAIYDCDGMNQSIDRTIAFGSLPAWLQKDMMTPYPVCSCGRSRYEPAAQADGYAKCSECRDEETCSRCGMEKRVTVIGTDLICADCQPLIDLEQIAIAAFPPERRQEIESEARTLLCGRALLEQDAVLFLVDRLDHLSESRRADQLRHLAGYRYYYFGQGGVWGSKFDPIDLELLADSLPRTSGNGLVKNVAAWLAGGCQRTSECNPWDYYYRTVVKEEKAVQPSFSATSFDRTTLLAVRLLGPETDRQTAIEGYRSVVERFGADSEGARRIVGLLDSNVEDYAPVLNTIREEMAFADAPLRLLSVLRDHFDTCPICGQVQDWTEEKAIQAFQAESINLSCQCPFSEPAKIITGALDQWATTGVEAVTERKPKGSVKATGIVLFRTMIGDVPAVSLAAYDKYGQWNLPLVIDPNAFRSDAEPHFETLWRQPSEIELKLDNLRRLRETYDTQVQDAENRLSDGWIRKLEFRPGKNPRTKAFQWEAGTTTDRGIKFVVDEKSPFFPFIRERVFFYCEQGRSILNTGRFEVILVTPFLEAGRNIDAEIAELERQLEGGDQASVVSEPPHQ